MPYHKFVFDKDKRKFLGEFEGMYKSEEQEDFDSWNISNLSILSRRIHLESQIHSSPSIGQMKMAREYNWPMNIHWQE